MSEKNETHSSDRNEAISVSLISSKSSLSSASSKISILSEDMSSLIENDSVKEKVMRINNKISEQTKVNIINDDYDEETDDDINDDNNKCVNMKMNKKRRKRYNDKDKKIIKLNNKSNCDNNKNKNNCEINQIVNNDDNNINNDNSITNVVISNNSKKLKIKLKKNMKTTTNKNNSKKSSSSSTITTKVSNRFMDRDDVDNNNNNDEKYEDKEKIVDNNDENTSEYEEVKVKNDGDIDKKYNKLNYDLPQEQQQQEDDDDDDDDDQRNLKILESDADMEEKDDYDDNKQHENDDKNNDVNKMQVRVSSTLETSFSLNKSESSEIMPSKKRPEIFVENELKEHKDENDDEDENDDDDDDAKKQNKVNNNPDIPLALTIDSNESNKYKRKTDEYRKDNKNTDDMNANKSTNKYDEDKNNAALKKKFKDEITGEWICPVCNTKLDSQHSFTVHIRQHNPTDHSHTCSICGKTLSSASSLDRHMLIHSGERPFKCRICNMAFTTNGNMHRHMRTHGMELNEHDSHDNNNNTNSPRIKMKKRKTNSHHNRQTTTTEMKSVTQRRTTESKILNSSSSLQQLNTNNSSNILNGNLDQVNLTNSHLLRCQICGKSDFNSKTTLATHIETHTNEPIKCLDCGKIFLNYTLLNEHRCLTNGKFGLQSKSTLPTTQMNVPSGFHDLNFTDFTAEKFSLIAKQYCEENRRKTSSSYHDFECKKCEKAFPCSSALNLHEAAHNLETYCNQCQFDCGTRALYLSHQIKHGLKCDDNLVIPQEKEHFLGLLNLQNRNQNGYSNDITMKRTEGIFDNPSYYIHAKPDIDLLNKSIQFHEKMINNKKDNDLPKHHDLADIQSIISMTSAPPMMMMTPIRSSPPAASPASPVQRVIGQTLNLKRKPDSPVPADSPHEMATSLVNTINKQIRYRVNDNYQEKESKKRKTNIINGDVDCDNCDFDDEIKETDEINTLNKANDGTYKCNGCEIKFDNLESLKRHNKTHKNYACQFCEYTSLDRSTLLRHLRIHNGERPYQCSICNYAFTTKANCERHLRKRHQSKGTTQIFGQNRALSENETKIITSNLTIQNLNKHNQLHNEKTINVTTICKYCNIDFKSDVVLRHHLQTTHNYKLQNAFICSICQISFTSKNNCYHHIISEHHDVKDDISSLIIAYDDQSNSLQSNTNTDYSESESVNTFESNYNNRYEDSSIYNYISKDQEKSNSIKSFHNHHQQQQQQQQKNNNHQEQQIQHQNQKYTNSLAALYQVAKSVANLDNEEINRFNICSENEEYDGDESNDNADETNGNLDEMPLDLVKNISSNVNKKEEVDSKRNTVKLDNEINFKKDAEQPLDLALHALDLSVKSKKSISSQNSEINNLHSSNLFDLKKNAVSSLLALQSIVPRPEHFLHSSTLLNTLVPVLPAHNAVPFHIPITQLNQPDQVSTATITLAATIPPTPLATTLPPQVFAQQISQPVVNTNTNNNILINDMYNIPNFQLSKSPNFSKNQRSFTCIYCAAGFTLKSNMERHIKRKHPEHARPSRNRGTPTPSIKDNLSVNTVNQIGPVSLLSKPNLSTSTPIETNSSTLSNKTRDALRVVLNSKGLNSTINTELTLESSPNSENSSHANIEQCNENHMEDLASVSSLIADTANSSNTLRKYFDKESENETKNNNNNENSIKKENLSNSSNDEKTIESDDNNDSNESLDNQIRPNDSKNKSFENDSNSSSKANPTITVPKKRSAYTDSPNSVSCPYCSRRFPWTSSLRRHILTHTGLKPYKCPKCPILFTTKSNCERHLVRKHGGDSKKASAKFLQQTNATNSSNDKHSIKSNISTANNLRKHYYARHLNKSNKGPSLLKFRANNERSNVNEIDHSISKCKKKEDQINNENKQISEDADDLNDAKLFDLQFKCHICDNLSFSDRIECLTHLQTSHPDEYETLLTKGAVDKVPTSETKLTLAIKSGDIDGDKNKIYCVFCPRQFNFDENLRRHMKVHLGERPYKCNLCPRRFSLKNSLLRHCRTNHPEAPVPIRTKSKRRVSLLKTDANKNEKKTTLINTNKELVENQIKKDNQLAKNGCTEETSNDGTDLIQNLLGIQDSKIIDEMLDSADSAARLLGVKKMQ